MSSVSQNFVLTLAATFVGVLFALWSSHLYNRWRDEAERRSRERVVLRGYAQAITKSLKVLQKIASSFNGENASPHVETWTDRVEGERLEGLSRNAGEVVRNDKLLLRLEGFGFELRELNRKLDMQLQFQVGPIRAAYLQQPDKPAAGFTILEKLLKDYWHVIVRQAQELRDEAGQLLCPTCYGTGGSDGKDCARCWST